MTSFTSPELVAVIVQVVIVLLIIRRSFAMAQGVPFSGLRLALLPVLILILWGLSELESILLIPWALPLLIFFDLAILIGAALAVTPVAQRMTEVYRAGSGVLSYRIGFSLTAVFVGAFVIRLLVAVALYPGSLEFGAPPGGLSSTQDQIALGAVDALFSVSAGLLVARSVGVYRKVAAARVGAPTAEPR